MSLLVLRHLHVHPTLLGQRYPQRIFQAVAQTSRKTAILNFRTIGRHVGSPAVTPQLTRFQKARQWSWTNRRSIFGVFVGAGIVGSFLALRFATAVYEAKLRDDELARQVAEERDYLRVPVGSVVGWGFTGVLRRVLRFGYLLVVFLPLFLAAPLGFFLVYREVTVLTDSLQDPLLLRRDENFWFYRLIVWTLEHAGVTFIKLGQWLSHREDFAPPALCAALRRLRDHAPAHSLEHTRALLLESFGHTPEELFEKFDPVPVASGSVAQVHRARLRSWTSISGVDDPSRDVAVKILHPGVAEQMEMDLEMLFRSANYLSRLPLLDWMRVPVVLDEFCEILRRQVDLSLEARNLDRFRENFRRETVSVAFPTPIYPYVSTSVLVESWEEGENIQRYLDRNSPHNKQLAMLGFDVFMTMMLVHRFMHADCHAGNIFVRERPGRPLTMVVLDAGLVTFMELKAYTQFLMLMKDVVTRNGTHAARMFETLSKTKPQLPDLFRRQMHELFERTLGPEGPKPANVGRLISDIMSLVRRHGLVLESDFASVIISMSVLEGLARALDPELDLISNLVPYVFVHAKGVAAEALLSAASEVVQLAGEQSTAAARTSGAVGR